MLSPGYINYSSRHPRVGSIKLYTFVDDLGSSQMFGRFSIVLWLAYLVCLPITYSVLRSIFTRISIQNSPLNKLTSCKILQPTDSFITTLHTTPLFSHDHHLFILLIWRRCCHQSFICNCGSCWQSNQNWPMVCLPVPFATGMMRSFSAN